MEKLAIVGSGASGVHFALSVLRKGYQVVMLDVGRSAPEIVNANDSFTDLKNNLKDPVQYFLGSDYEGLMLPGSKGEYYGFPPNKKYVFSSPDSYQWKAEGFQPLFSFANGGLAQAWTGGVYPLTDRDLTGFPFRYADIEPYYSEVSQRIGITGIADDLNKFYPSHRHLMEPLRLDEHSQRLLAAYEEKKNYLNNKLHCFLGRSRVAVLSVDHSDRKACSHTGRCLWGCPIGAFYTPSLTLKDCLKFETFQYVPNVLVRHLAIGRNNHIQSIVAESLNDHQTVEFTAERFILAAGTLSSSRILIDSFRKATGEIIKLTGLMDNRQVLIPFLNLSMIGKEYNPDSYQYHQLAMGIETEDPDNYLHALITTLKSALVHPILQSIPMDLRTSIFLFRNLRAGLGLLNLNFPDYRRDTNFVTLEPGGQSGADRMYIHYSPPHREESAIKRGIKSVQKALWKLGCVVPPGMVHIRPMGASVHYAGTIPMRESRHPFTASFDCRSHDFENLYFVDGSTFPSLPAKNLTFTLMANAVRVADQAF